MAGTITFEGLATGIKASETVDKLITVESRPKILKEAEQTRIQNQADTWQVLNSKLLSVSVAAGDLSRLATWNNQTVTSSNESTLTARASLEAPTGTYTVSVEKLAKAHQVASQNYDSSTASIGTGALSIQVGSGATYTLTLSANNNTLDGVAKALNDAKIGVTASVVSTGGSYRLLLAANATGAENALSITQDEGVNLAFDLENPVQAAEDAQVKLGSGAGAIIVNSASNTINTLIKGVALDLKAADPGKPVTISVSRNSDAVAEKVKAFVDAYNDITAEISKQFAYDSDKNVAGILMGDSTLMGVQRSLSSLVSSTVASNSEYRTLSSVGITVGDGGKLSFDASKLSTAMGKDFEGTMRLFRTGADSTNTRISFVFAGAKTQQSTAGYAVDVTQVATRAAATGTAAAGLSIDAANDQLTLSVDGASPRTITLAHKTDYTAESLAAEIQAKINGSFQGKVTVAADGAGALTITSARYGSSSKIELIGGSGLTTLKLSGVAASTGQNVAGTINGEPATGTGQILKGNSGNAKTDGLQLLVELDGGLGAGPESTVTVTKGIFSRFDEYLSNLTDPLSGVAGLQQSSLTKSVESIATQIKEMEARLEVRRESLLAQFNRMEQTISELNNQGSYLTNALAALTKSSN
ncbi:MAG: flagellar filament capping protein FliD [Deltaproteobacteria bacterium]|nr:flagellar filament capping protein FliD [Deltaproteobacteria bacterium]